MTRRLLNTNVNSRHAAILKIQKNNSHIVSSQGGTRQQYQNNNDCLSGQLHAAVATAADASAEQIIDAKDLYVMPKGRSGPHEQMMKQQESQSRGSMRPLASRYADRKNLRKDTEKSLLQIQSRKLSIVSNSILPASSGITSYSSIQQQQPGSMVLQDSQSPQKFQQSKAGGVSQRTTQHNNALIQLLNKPDNQNNARHTIAAEESDNEKDKALFQVSFKTSNLKNLGRYQAVKASRGQLSNRFRNSGIDNVMTPSKSTWAATAGEQQRFFTEDKTSKAHRAAAVNSGGPSQCTSSPEQSPTFRSLEKDLKTGPQKRPTVLSGHNIDFSAAMGDPVSTRQIVQVRSKVSKTKQKAVLNLGSLQNNLATSLPIENTEDEMRVIDCNVIDFDIGQDIDQDGQSNLPNMKQNHKTAIELFNHKGAKKKPRAFVAVKGRSTTLGSVASEDSEGLMLVAQNDGNFISSMSKSGTAKQSVTQLQDPSTAIVMPTPNQYQKSQTGRASVTKTIINMGIPPLAPIAGSQTLGQGGAKSSRSISTQKKLLQKHVTGSLLHSYALKGKRMNIEEGLHSNRQNPGDSQQQIQRIDQQSSLHSQRTFDSASGAEKTNQSTQGEQLIAIKIVDNEKRVIKTFIEKKDLIVGQMRYFAQHIGKAKSEKKHKNEQNVDTEDKDIVDIQISCDAKIFKFLIDCCTELHRDGSISEQSSNNLSQRLLFPVLVSSVFLQIEKLIIECLAIWKRNFALIMHAEQIPVLQLQASIFTRLGEAISIEKLVKFQKDSQNKQQQLNEDMLQRLYMHHAFRLLDEESFTTCQYCQEIYPAAKSHKLKCQANKDLFVDNSEQAIQIHVADRQLDLKRLCEFANVEENLPWRVIFARILARSLILPRCQVCLEKTSSAYLKACSSHLDEPNFAGGAHIGVYPCCGQHVIRAAYEQYKDEAARMQKMPLTPRKTISGRTEQSIKSKKDMNFSLQPRQCDQPHGCNEQEHTVNWNKLTDADRISLDFLRLPDISTQVFMTANRDINTKKRQRQSFVGLVHEFKRRVIGSLRKHHMEEIGDHIWGTGSSQRRSPSLVGRSRLLDYAIGGILEHFEDDYGSSDCDSQESSEFYSDRQQSPGNREDIKAAQNDNTNQGARNLLPHRRPYNNTESEEDQIFAATKSLTQHKVRVQGRDIIHKFKFNLQAKQATASRIFISRRDERLRALVGVTAQDDQVESRLAIPSTKEVFVGLLTLNSQNQRIRIQENPANAILERKQRLCNMDEHRMQQLKSYLIALREPEKSIRVGEQKLAGVAVAAKVRTQVNNYAFKNIVKYERDQLAQQQRQTVNRLSMNKDRHNPAAAVASEANITSSASPQLLQESSRQQPVMNISMHHSPSKVTQRKKLDQGQIQIKKSIVPIAYHTGTSSTSAYINPQSISSQTMQLSVPAQLQQKVVQPTLFQSMTPAQRIARAAHTQVKLQLTSSTQAQVQQATLSGLSTIGISGGQAKQVQRGVIVRPPLTSQGSRVTRSSILNHQSPSTAGQGAVFCPAETTPMASEQKSVLRLKECMGGSFQPQTARGRYEMKQGTQTQSRAGQHQPSQSLVGNTEFTPFHAFVEQQYQGNFNQLSSSPAQKQSPTILKTTFDLNLPLRNNLDDSNDSPQYPGPDHPLLQMSPAQVHKQQSRNLQKVARTGPTRLLTEQWTGSVAVNSGAVGLKGIDKANQLRANSGLGSSKLGGQLVGPRQPQKQNNKRSYHQQSLLVNPYKLEQ